MVTVLGLFLGPKRSTYTQVKTGNYQEDSDESKDNNNTKQPFVLHSSLLNQTFPKWEKEHCVAQIFLIQNCLSHNKFIASNKLTILTIITLAVAPQRKFSFHLKCVTTCHPLSPIKVISYSGLSEALWTLLF